VLLRSLCNLKTGLAWGLSFQILSDLILSTFVFSCLPQSVWQSAFSLGQALGWTWWMSDLHEEMRLNFLSWKISSRSVSLKLWLWLTVRFLQYGLEVSFFFGLQTLLAESFALPSTPVSSSTPQVVTSTYEERCLGCCLPRFHSAFCQAGTTPGWTFTTLLRQAQRKTACCARSSFSDGGVVLSHKSKLEVRSDKASLGYLSCLLRMIAVSAMEV